MKRFLDYKFKDYINETLNDLGFIKPTLVQEKTISRAIKGESLMVESATGSGKTHSYLIPIFQKLNEYEQSCQAVIIAPTRELAEQLYNNALVFAKHCNKQISVAKVVGGVDKEQELKKYQNNTPQVIISTIGRLHDLSVKNNALKIYSAKTVVIDEADMIFEEKEIVEVDNIMAKFVEEPQFLIFSATLSKGLRSFLNTYLRNIDKIILEEKNLTKENIDHLMLQCKAKDKKECLLDLLKVINPYLGIVFVNTKESCDEIALMLSENGYKVGKLHGDLTDRERKSILRRINDLEYNYLVATDIAARGIDIQGVTHVINVDLPKDIDFYIHRCGRTARYDKRGIAISLYAYDDDAYVKTLRNKGLIVKFVKIIDGEIVETKMVKRQTHSFVRDIESQVHAKHKMPNKVKPGYKKKRNEEINKEIRKLKREHIEEIYREKAKRERRNK